MLRFVFKQNFFYYLFPSQIPLNFEYLNALLFLFLLQNSDSLQLAAYLFGIRIFFQPEKINGKVRVNTCHKICCEMAIKYRQMTLRAQCAHIFKENFVRDY